VTESDLAFSSPECHLPILATAAKGSAGLSMEKDAPYSTSTIRESITATADTAPQLLSPSLVTDLGTGGPSTCSLGTENIEHCLIDPAHSPYDIV
jgi:hypothetical protein